MTDTNSTLYLSEAVDRVAIDEAGVGLNKQPVIDAPGFVAIDVSALFRSAVLTLSLILSTQGVAGEQAHLPEPLGDDDYLLGGSAPALKSELGRQLFFDPILSGNRNISCGTCHDPATGTGDGLSLGIGEGGSAIGQERRTAEGVIGRVPRNAQPLYNVGALEYTSMFHDGRLEPDPLGTFISGFWSPAREQLPSGLNSLLAAQAMFPVLSPVEMAGQKGENAVTDAMADDRLAGPDGAWDLLAQRLREIPAYASLFIQAFSDVKTADDISFVHAANALAVFQSIAFRSDHSPFDDFLAGEKGVLSDSAQAGMAVFYGSAGCAECHSGPLLTDHKFHAIATPQIGPGKGHGQDTTYWRAAGFSERLEDEGRFRVTFESEDLFRFRTPSLRNVALTGPWGHAGTFQSLESAVRHHLNPNASLEKYDTATSQPALPVLHNVIERTAERSSLSFTPLNPARREVFALRDFWIANSEKLRSRISEANELEAIELSEEQIIDLVAFLHSLTDASAQLTTVKMPERVPSGLLPQPTRLN